MELTKLKVGDKVWVKPTNRLSGVDSPIEEKKVTKVGRLWFEIEGVHRCSFSVETLEEKGDRWLPRFRVYRTKADYDAVVAECEDRARLNDLMRSTHKLSIEKVREILAILAQ